MPQSIRVILADDQPEICADARVPIEAEPGIDLVAVVESCPAVLEVVQVAPPDVVIMGIRGMGGSVIQTIIELQKLDPPVAVILYTSALSYALRLMRYGVLGVVAKADDDELPTAILAVHRGERYFSEAVQRWRDNPRHTGGV